MHSLFLLIYMRKALMRMTSTKLVFSVSLFGFFTHLLVEGQYLPQNQQCTAKSPHLYLNGSIHGIMQVNAIELEQLLSSSRVPVMAEFYATWCGDCQVGNLSADIYLVHSFYILIGYYFYIVHSSSFVN